MKTKRLMIPIVVFAFFLFTAFSCNECDPCPETEVNNPTDLDAVREVLSDYATHGSAEDFDSWIALWMEDGRQMPPNTAPRIGTAALTAAMKPGWEVLDLEIEITTIDDIQVYGDIGFTRCSYNIYATPKSGGDRFPIEPDGKALTIYKRQNDGSWKIWFDCFNSNLAPPSP